MSAPSIEPFEKLASFYLGRHFDLETSRLQDDLLMYEAKDLCTHAMCVGMTGSGKTGLCIALLEEAALDGVPVICLDPKGDLANLMLTFPELRAEDFQPWVERSDADRQGMTIPMLAAKTAQRWSQGLAAWGQTPQRIQRFKDAVDVAVYTPGSNAGLPLTVLKSFDAPAQALLDDAEALRKRVTTATSGLLTLLGIDADPLLSPDHILISSILDTHWRAGKNVSVGDLIGLIQRPPMTRIGILDVDSFMPPAARTQLAMRLNGLLASPAFSHWLEGESLSISRLLYTSAGKPRLTILSIAHLNDAERMFFVTVLLNELLAWTRAQQGTSSLRALFYMDEVAGYFPPSAIPPSKPPMLTLLKQARAYGLGIMLATQNPVDLDYKALSNIGTWFLGRLQTERDKARVLEGLEGAAIQTGSRFNRSTIQQQLAALGNRVFLMKNIHDEQPVVFQSRWAMSYLAGPLTRSQIANLMASRKQDGRDGSQSEDGDSLSTAVMPAPMIMRAASLVRRPVVPTQIAERFLSPSKPLGHDCTGIYRPALLAVGSVHHVRASAGLDRWADVARLLDCVHGIPPDDWTSSMPITVDLQLNDSPEAAFGFQELPDALRGEEAYAQLEKRFGDYLYRFHRMTLYKLAASNRFAPADSSAGEARIHFTQFLRELRDAESEKLKARYAARAKALEKRIRDAGERVSREQSQYQDSTVHSAISVGSTILGAFLGRKLVSQSTLSRTATAIRGASKTKQAKHDVVRAEDALRQLELDLADLNAEIELALKQLAAKHDVANLELAEISIPPRKADLKVTPLTLLWTPWQVDRQETVSPLYAVNP